MNIHEIFHILALIAIFLLTGGSFLVLLSRKRILRRVGEILFISGVLLVAAFIAILTLSLNRMPFRTLGETRLLYSFFLPVTGLILYFRWKQRWMLLFSSFMAVLFLVLNLVKPENFDNTLAPALQSIWFAPHVIVYIFAYTLLGAATMVAVYTLIRHKSESTIIETAIYADNLVYSGFAFLTFGLIFGAIWAKEAWGNYWTWDPKETWAMITWLVYILYIHYRHHKPLQSKQAMLILTLAFFILLVCWFGISYLPVSQNSVHIYSGN